jgi:predicted metal-dependent phosphoesterase TrpH
LKQSKIDLHVHTTVSDGTLSPSEVVKEAAARGVSILGIADHDITDGLPEAQQAAEGTGITLVPGVELSVGAGKREIHVLGYFVDHRQRELQEKLAWVRAARDRRNARIVERLAELGASVDARRVQEIAGSGSVGRPHIAAALVEVGHVSSQLEAFHRYLARGKAAYVSRERMEPKEACEVVRGSGGLPVLAHPAKSGSLSQMEELVGAGMEGIEVYHCDHKPDDVKALLSFARERSLLVTGGSDSHGPHSDRPVPIGGVEVPEWVGEELLAWAPEWWREER